MSRAHKVLPQNGQPSPDVDGGQIWRRPDARKRQGLGEWERSPAQHRLTRTPPGPNGTAPTVLCLLLGRVIYLFF